MKKSCNLYIASKKFSSFNTFQSLFGWEIKLKKKTGLRRCGKSCRLRWKNYLNPDIKRGPFTFEEEKLILQLQARLGNRYLLLFFLSEICFKVSIFFFFFCGLFRQVVYYSNTSSRENRQRYQEPME